MPIQQISAPDRADFPHPALVQDFIAFTHVARSTARNANARSVSLLRSNADRIEGEWTSSRNRKTVAASVSLCIGGKFCRSKSRATLMASTIRRSGVMRKQRRRGNRLGELSDVLFVPGMGRMAG